MKEQSQEKPEEQSLKIIYRRTILSSFGGGLINPFVHIYAAQMGASPVEMGWVRAMNTISANIAQIPWGLTIDWLKKRAIFVFLGGLLYALLFLPLLFVDNVLEFLVVISLSSIFAAMIGPALNSLIGDLCEEGNRGKVYAQLNAMASIGSIPATVIGGYILYKASGSLKEIYRIPVISGFLLTSAAAFLILKIKERGLVGETFRLKGWTEALKANRYFRRLCIVSSAQGFFMAMAWPMFTLTIVRVIEADMFQISLLSVVSGFTAIIVRRLTGRLADRAGRKPLLVIGRAGLFLIPLIYAFATSIDELILLELVIGIVSASSDVALSAYLLDISPKGSRGSYMGLYNALTGLLSFLGSLSAGYLMNHFIGLGYGFQDAMFIVYMVSMTGRLVGGMLFATLEEPYRYPAKFREELESILKEQVEKIEEELESVEQIAEKFKKLEDEDIEWFEKISTGRP